MHLQILDKLYWAGLGQIAKIVAIDVPKNCIKYAEKSLIDGKLKAFAESGFNTNVLFFERWVNADNTINVERMVKDLSLVYNDDKVTQKLVTDSANKRLEAYLKEKKQITVGSEPSQSFSPSNYLTEFDKVREAAFGSWLSII